VPVGAAGSVTVIVTVVVEMETEAEDENPVTIELTPEAEIELLLSVDAALALERMELALWGVMVVIMVLEAVGMNVKPALRDAMSVAVAKLALEEGVLDAGMLDVGATELEGGNSRFIFAGVMVTRGVATRDTGPV